MRTLKTKEIAELLGLTQQRCRQLADESVLVRLASNAFDGPASVRSYMQYREKKLTDDLGGPGSLNAERRKLVAERARIAEIERAKLEGELVPAAQIGPVWAAGIDVIRTRMLAMPSKIAAKLGMCTTTAERQEVVRREVYDALTEVSQTTFTIADGEHSDEDA